MNKLIIPALVAVLSLGLFACQSAQEGQSVELLPEISLTATLDSNAVERADDWLEDNHPQYWVVQPEGVYVYAQPNTDALKLQTLYPGDYFRAERVDAEWVRLVISRSVEHGWELLVGYARLQGLSTRWQDATLHNGLMNQINGMSYPEAEEYVLPPDNKRFFQHDAYAHVELVDQATYETAAKERVDQYVLDTLAYPKQGGKLSLPTKQGPLVLEDLVEPGTDDQELAYTYLGRLSSGGPYIVHERYYEGAGYSIYSPDTGKLILEPMYMYGYPYLSPKGDYIIAVAEDYGGVSTEVYIIKVGANKQYELHGVLSYPFWHPYKEFHEPQVETEYWEPSAEYFLPDGRCFWSKDGYFYLRVRPSQYNHKTAEVADPRAYYARIKILPPKVFEYAPKAAL